MMLTTRLAFSQENCSNAISLNSSGLYTINTISGGTTPEQLCTENVTGNMNSGEWNAYTSTQNFILRHRNKINICILSSKKNNRKFRICNSFAQTQKTQLL